MSAITPDLPDDELVDVKLPVKQRDESKAHSMQLTSLSSIQKQLLFDDISRRLIEHHSRRRIAADLGISASSLNTIIRSKAFRKRFVQVHESIFKPVEDAMRNEAMEITKRVELTNQRSITALGVVFDRFINGTPIQTRDPRTGQIRKHAPVSAQAVVKAAETLLNRDPRTPIIRRQINEGSATLSLDERSVEVLGNVFNSLAAQGDINVIDVTPDQLPENAFKNDEGE